MQKNINPRKLNEKSIIKTLSNAPGPMLLSDLSSQLKCNSKDLEQYLSSMEKNGLIITSKYECKENEKYSSKRGKTTYCISCIAIEYIAEKERNFIAFICTLIAAIMATLTLIATVLIPFIS
ncbi:MAG: hypothetical protein ACLTOQ_05045 [Gallintestinimicrobium sp.]|uniref:hypothetical protein n=1 Tax=Gallintestinimicrobium sp. TaxID=2981655 RepID=UPI003991B21D